MGRLADRAGDFVGDPRRRNLLYDILVGRVPAADGSLIDDDDVAAIAAMVDAGRSATAIASALSDAGWSISESPVARFLNGATTEAYDHPLYGYKKRRGQTG